MQATIEKWLDALRLEGIELPDNFLDECCEKLSGLWNQYFGILGPELLSCETNSDIWVLSRNTIFQHSSTFLHQGCNIEPPPFELIIRVLSEKDFRTVFDPNSLKMPLNSTGLSIRDLCDIDDQKFAMLIDNLRPTFPMAGHCGVVWAADYHEVTQGLGELSRKHLSSAQLRKLVSLLNINLKNARRLTVVVYSRKDLSRPIRTPLLFEGILSNRFRMWTACGSHRMTKETEGSVSLREAVHEPTTVVPTQIDWYPVP